MTRPFHLVFAMLALGSVWSVPAEAADEVSFNMQIRPILSDRCWACHGPDEAKRKAKLRLDTREGALARKDGKAIIQPGDPANSELYRRLVSNDPDEKMPPADSHLEVSSEEIAVINRWIEQGAQWEKHWAYLPPRKISPPAVQDSAWVKNDIDRFILVRLEKVGIKPAAESAKERLLRRVTFDLTGLPPTPDEMDAFVNDSSPDAYEHVVDRLLASQAYGERMAVDWLDLARYSDTFGYQADRYRAMWPWRDWVIKAFNENIPYDQFATWQLAGDLLPNPTKEQILATAFNRHHMQTEEGGSVEEEFRVTYVVDRVNTMGTTFMAQTFECSRCHDHKYDPISQKDFYSLFSFFNNIDESGQTSHFTDSMPVPTLLLSDADTDRRLAELKRAIAEKESKTEPLRRNARAAFEEWLKEEPTELNIKGLIADLSFDEIKDNKFPNAANAKKPAHAVEAPQLVDGRAGKALSLNGENGVTLNDLGIFGRTDPFTVSVWIRSPVHHKRAVVFHRSMAALDAASRGYEMLLEDGYVSLGLHHMWPGNAIKVRSKSSIPTNDWVHLVMTYDGSSRADGLRLFSDGTPTELEVMRDNLWKDIIYERGNPQLTVGYRFRDNGFRDGVVDDLIVYDRALTEIEVLHLHDGKTLKEALLAHANTDALFDFYLANFNILYAKHLQDLRELRAQQSRLINPIPEVMAMHEMPQARPAFILKRGAYDAPGDPVTMDVPAAIMPFDAKYPRNRLGLAQWLFAEENPLTARVAANRLWQMMFGRGIVSSADNFGSQGDLPTHPELLDWLADDLRKNRWDVKRFLKQIAMTSTYRQSSSGSPESTLKDPENKLLARGPAHRLTAEMIRDNALAASGLLVRKMGGEPVKPYQPEGLWEEKSGARYERDRGDALYRRSVYTFWKRTSPPPVMIAFDAAERNVCIVTRQATSTPLQALALLNDPQIAEASRHLAERAIKEGGSTIQSRLSFMFRLATSRNPISAELEVLNRMFEEQRQILSRNEHEVAKFLMVGDKSNDPAIPPVELASTAIVANALFNFDETVMKR